MNDMKKVEPTATLVAVWPGMGQVALTAGHYLVSRLQMKEAEALPAQDLFDVEHVDVKDGLVVKGSPQQGRLFLWKNPKNQRDLAVYIGESQPPPGKHAAFCDRLLDDARKLGVRDVYTFAAMATDMHPTAPSQVVGVATDVTGLAHLQGQDVAILKAGRISGLNGVFLAAAAERGMHGIGLLGEIPSLAAQVPFPKASRVVLEAFAGLAGVDLDFQELTQYERTVERQFTEIIGKLEQSVREKAETHEPEGEQGEEPEFASEPEPGLSNQDRQRIEDLFAQAQKNRRTSFELKRELDRLEVFKDYEDRFLDLFRKSA